MRVLVPAALRPAPILATGIQFPTWIVVLYWAVIAAAIVTFIFGSAAFVRRWAQRRRVSHAGAGQQREWRGQFIAALIERVGRDTHRSTRLGAICNRLGWSLGQADLIMGYLTAKGLVEKTALMKGMGEPFETIGAIVGRERVRLTAAGLDEAERAEQGPTENLPQITAINSIVVAGDNANVAGAVNSPDSSQAIEQQGIDPRAVTEWIGEYWEAMSDGAELSAAERARAEHLLMRLEDANRKHDHERVTKLGRALGAIAEGVVGNAAYGALVAAAQRLFG